ncbi:hypothetical protein EX895_003801 [Sporisorium graminicola]|uniref:DUF1479 domain protein n=1 Tax=Sporisorium graminicola TaxID=280036 RepID=A0A4U7KRN2_9BASI|nr:hypothetical protein EX895_003801 [Sporisorium graminicola]TKY87124.1 hypothetical protein EX895_003801 [Sporisorium graminicola]
MLRTVLGSARRAPCASMPTRRWFAVSAATFRPSLDTVAPTTTTNPPPPPSAATPKKAGKGEGTIASVFATLSGGTLEDALPDRFATLKQSLVESPAHAEHLERTWRSVLAALSARVEETTRLGGRCIPEVEFPAGAEGAEGGGEVGGVHEWTDAATFEAIKDRGVAVIRNVIPQQQVLAWKDDIRAYARHNNAKGFPEDNPQVYELYWTRAQLAARSHPNLLTTSQRFLQLFHRPAPSASHTSEEEADVERACSLAHPLAYVDRLRIRQPGDAQFALGPHIDGGGVERWECDQFRALWHHILADGAQWEAHDPWSLGAHGERMTARTDMYDGPGQCGVFRPLQGWLSMSSTRVGEGTLKVLPFLRESTAYIVLRPLFRALKPPASCASQAEYLAPDNWTLDPTSRSFPGCSLGHNIELSATTHPHLHLDQTMVSIPRVEPGDMVLWHCDAVHSVEARHAGQADSSVLYIPAIPTTKVNWQYVMLQRKCFERGVPPPDFPGGTGESTFQGRATPDMVQGTQARLSLGLERFPLARGEPQAETRLLEWCNAQL